MPVDGGHHFIEPFWAGEFLGERVTREMLHAITSRMAKRFEQADPHQRRDVMGGNAQRFGHFLLGHDDGKFLKYLQFYWRFGIHTFSLVKVRVTAATWVFTVPAKRRWADFTNFNSYA